MTISNADDEREPFSLHTSAGGGLTRMRVSGVLDQTTSDTLDQAVLVAISRGADRLLIDLSALTGIDARGVERLLALRITCALQRVAVQFTRPARDLAEALDAPDIHPPLPFTE